MLEKLTAADFADCLGDDFSLLAPGGERLTFSVAEVGERGTGMPGSPRTPFYVLFKGPREPLMPQRIYRLEHPRLGELDLFIVPVGREPEAIVYEAVFG